jgi:hypothetical protein
VIKETRLKEVKHARRLSVSVIGLASLFAGSVPANLSAATAAVSTGFRTLPAAPLGGTNPWPVFRFQIKGSRVTADKTLQGEDREGLLETTCIPPLPTSFRIATPANADPTDCPP